MFYSSIEMCRASAENIAKKFKTKTCWFLKIHFKKNHVPLAWLY